MKDFISTIRKLEKTRSRNEKIGILKQITEREREIFEMVLNPYLPFRLQKLPEIKIHPIEAVTLSWDKIKDMLTQMSELAAMTNEMRFVVKNALEMVSQEDAEILGRVFLKNLRCGVDVSTYNEVYPGSIKEFKIQLSAKLDENKIKLEDIVYPCCVDVKYDGYRCLAIPDYRLEKYYYYSKEGREFVEYVGMFDKQLLALSNELGKGPVVFDGELTGADYKSVAKSRGKKGDKSGLILNVFDFIPAIDFESLKSNMPLVDRYTDMARSFDYTEDLRKGSKNRVEMTHFKVCHSQAELVEYYQKSLDDGFEGVIIKDLYSTYHYKRDKTFIKWKPELEADGYVEEVLLGDPNGVFYNTFGSIVVSGTLENGEKFRCKCGSGFPTDMKERERLWSIRTDMVGRRVVLNYQETTLADDAVYGLYSLRFPVYKRFKDDKE